MSNKYQSRIIFNSRNSGEIVIDINSAKKKDNIIQSMTTNNALNSFPTANIQLSITKKYRELRSLEKNDTVQLFASRDDTPMTKVFSGECVDLEIEGKNSNQTIKIFAISPFFRLQHLYINQSSLELRSLRSTFKYLLTSSGIRGEIVIDDDVEDSFEINYCTKYPAFSILQIIALQKDLVYNFHRGDVMQIMNRSTYIKEKMNKEPQTIGREDIISFKIKK